MNDTEKGEDTTITLDPATYAELSLYLALDSRKKKTRQSWDQFFDKVVKDHERHYQLTDWAYTLGIFFLVTMILTIPFYLIMPAQALALFPAMVIVGFIGAIFTAYILTPFSLRHFRPYQEDPHILQYLDELASRAQIKTPKLLVAETPEINALAFLSPFGGRVCLTRGILDANNRGDLSDDELKAIMGHEIGHIKHGDCFKWSFILSWLSIFDLIGTLLLVIGGAFIATGAVTSVLSDRDNSGPLFAILGIGMVIAGILQRLIGKAASIPALHLSRRHEYAADLTGARLTSPEAHVSALQKIERYNNQLAGQQLAQLPFSDRWQNAPLNMSWIDGLFSTHPPTEKRVREIEEIYEYQAQPLEVPRYREQRSPAPVPSQPFPAAAVIKSTSPPGAGVEKIAEKYDEVWESPDSGPDSVHDEKPGHLKEKVLRRKHVIPVIITLGLVLAGIFFILPSIVQSTSNPLVAPSDPAPASPPPAQTVIVTTPSPTTLVTTSPPAVVSPVSLGQSATVSLPHTEKLDLKFTPLYRYFNSPSLVTITYDVVARQVTEIKEISSPSGDYTKTVTYNDPNAYLVITVRDTDSREVIATSGFGRTYSSSPQQKMIVRRAGNLEMEVTGSRVTVDLAIR